MTSYLNDSFCMRYGMMILNRAQFPSVSWRNVDEKAPLNSRSSNV